jgi:phosphoribosyl 1,2-cyclic phosphodiesterase
VPLKFASLGSGSQGNGLVIVSEETHVLVDCGFSKKEAELRLERLDIDPNLIEAVLVTHEHGDHVGGVAGFSKKYSIPVYCTQGTLQASPSLEADLEVKVIKGYASFKIKDLTVNPYPVPHDAREPSQFTIVCGQDKLGILTDCGSVTAHMIEQLKDCSALFVEFNHDQDMLNRSQYPQTLKHRITGGFGHINNVEAIELLERVSGPNLEYVVAAHLSRENNDPDLVRGLIAQSLGWDEERVDIATQELGVGWRTLGAPS